MLWWKSHGAKVSSNKSWLRKQWYWTYWIQRLVEWMRWSTCFTVWQERWHAQALVFLRSARFLVRSSASRFSLLSRLSRSRCLSSRLELKESSTVLLGLLLLALSLLDFSRWLRISFTRSFVRFKSLKRKMRQNRSLTLEILTFAV